MQYTYFGIGFYGECFAGKDMVGLANMLQSSKASEKCVKGDFKKCSNEEEGDHECVGAAHAEYIYTIQEKAGDEQQGD